MWVDFVLGTELKVSVGLVDPPLGAASIAVQVHDVIASLSVSEQLDPLDQARRVPHDGVVRGIVVHKAEGHLDQVESSRRL